MVSNKKRLNKTLKWTYNLRQWNVNASIWTTVGRFLTFPPTFCKFPWPPFPELSDKWSPWMQTDVRITLQSRFITRWILPGWNHCVQLVCVSCHHSTDQVQSSPSTGAGSQSTNITAMSTDQMFCILQKCQNPLIASPNHHHHHQSRSSSKWPVK